jgi:biotin operon repressor
VCDLGKTAIDKNISNLKEMGIGANKNGYLKVLK